MIVLSKLIYDKQIIRSKCIFKYQIALKTKIITQFKYVYILCIPIINKYL